VRNAEVIKKMLAKYCPDVEVLAIEPTVEKAVLAIHRHNPALVFLDIELPDGTGFNVLEHFPSKAFHVVFITAHQHYALKALKASAVDFLLKPVDISELVAAVEKVKAGGSKDDMQQRRDVLMHNSNPQNSLMQKIALPTQEGLLFVSQQDIMLCQAEGNYTSLKLKTNESILVSKPLAHFEELLDTTQFCRTHQSYLVNLNYIKKYIKGRGGYLVMHDGAKVEVSVRMKNEFLDRFGK
jgi:two-component system LytT family response regulator